ncbi:PREDICTED: spindle pole body component 110 [Tarenaya hassleriana]|uniref:spindle pole body component 110 n=1 Tax=Tarenaya hassleriana TaxID=28532 RepID=UPI00053C51D0|nr:PREDICTED: spindle pole body component 110 [Tarenaya hassleriana]
MDENLGEKEKLRARIKQLEHERGELQKDIEQLCMQQAGPSILGVATRMHLQRTANLDQEIESLKVKLTACTREKLNLQEELAEAYRVKAQLADLHAEEVAKNLEAEKQVKFFQNSVAAAFAERDNSIMEAEKAMENAEMMSLRLSEIEKRLEELNSDCLEQKRLNDTLQADLVNLEEETRIYVEVIDKFYNIRKISLGESEEMSSHEKCACLLDDPEETWTFNDPSTSKYVAALEGELRKIKSTVDSLQSKLRVGLEIENHLKKKVRELEKKNIFADKLILNGIAGLRHYHSQQRACIMNLLNEEGQHIRSFSETLEEKFGQFLSAMIQDSVPRQPDVKPNEDECRDVHMTTVVESDQITKLGETALPKELAENKVDASDEALTQALQEKVAALLLLSQEEERHLLEKNVNVALQKKVEELQRNVLQVTNEKVRVLLELARLRQEYQSLKEKMAETGGEEKHENIERRIITHEKEGRLKNLLKKTNINRWIGVMEPSSREVGAHLYSEADYARMKIEYAAFKESLESMGHLTNSVRRLRLALLKVKESMDTEMAIGRYGEAINKIIMEANRLKTALGISIPISWSAEADAEASGDSSEGVVDSVSAAGFEMVELVVLASEILRGNGNRRRDHRET